MTRITEEVPAMTQADALIARCNAATVEEARARVAALSPEERRTLMEEYRRRPDGRFGDNLLLALSALSHHFEVRF